MFVTSQVSSPDNIVVRGYEGDDNFTDDASVVESLGNLINLIEGDYKNIKITTPEDLLIAAVFLQ
jgi:2-C-methyl-D-erythritol 4-phosphate cytidylyltransferase